MKTLTMEFIVYLVNPAYTSRIGEKLGKERGLDKHTASAYVLAVKALQPKVFEILKNHYNFQNYPSIQTSE